MTRVELKVVRAVGESSPESNMSNWARMRAERLKRRPPLEGCLKADAKLNKRLQLNLAQSHHILET